MKSSMVLGVGAFAALVLAVAPVARGQVRAFGDAVGFGAGATGGRAGSVYVVTNLSNSGTGSFRDAVSQSNRTIVFAVSGYIDIASPISCASNLTIEGQTAPGGGIGVYGAEVSFYNTGNDVVRYMRFMDTTLDPKGQGTGNSSGNCLNLGNTNNMVLDHVSCEFASYNNIDAVGANNLTVQNCIIANPIPDQQFNVHWEGSQGTFVNNIFANAHNRSILSKGNVQFVNNSVYNYQAGFTTGNSAGNFSFDVLNNYFVAGPSTSSAGDNYYQVDSNQKAYASGNLLSATTNGTLSPTGSNTVDSATALASPWSSSSVSLATMSAGASYAWNMVHAGDSVTHDPTTFATSLGYNQVDQQVVGDLASNGTAGRLYNTQTDTGLSNGGLGTITAGTAPVSTAGDGIPDYWKVANGLSPSVSYAGAYNPLGYTFVEQYANQLGAMNGTVTMTASGSFTAASNWAGGVLPAVVNYAQIRGNGTTNTAASFLSGTSTVESLSIGGNGPAAGESLTVSGGAFNVYDTIYLGDQGNGTLTLSGGTLSTWNMQLGNGSNTGTFNLTAGTFSAGGVVGMGGGSTPGTYTYGGQINFSGGTVLATGSLTIHAPVAISGSGGTFSLNGNTVTLSGVVSGATTLVATGSGMLVLSGSSTFSGAIDIKSGIVLGVTGISNAGAAGPLGNQASPTSANLILDGATLQDQATSGFSTNISFAVTQNGATLDAAGAAQWTFAGTSTVAMTGSGNRTLTLTGTTTNPNIYLVLTDPASGKLSLDKENTGRWLISAGAATNSYSGDTVINNGTLLTNAANILPYGTGKGNLDINAGQLEMNGNNLSINGLNGAAGNLNNRSHTQTVTLGNGNASGAFGGTITSVGGSSASYLDVVKTGTGTQVFSGTCTYGGYTLVNQGLVSFTAGTAISAGADISVAGTGAVSLSASGTAQSLNLVGVTCNVTALGAAGLSVTGTGSTAALTFNFVGASGTDTRGIPLSLTGTVADTGGVTLTTSATMGQATWLSAMNLGSVERVFNIGQGGGNVDLELAGPVSGTSSIVKSGAGCLQFAASSPVAGPISLTAGTLSFALGNNLFSAVPALGVSGGVLDLNSTTQTFSTVTFSGGSTTSTGTLGASSFVLSPVAPAVVSVATTLANAGSVTASLTFTGSGTATVTGSLNYTGRTTMAGSGELLIAEPFNKPTATLYSTGSGTLALGAPVSAPAYALAANVAGISVTGTGTVLVPAVARSGALERVLVAGKVSIAAGARLDLSDNDMLVTGMSETAVRGLVAGGELTSSYGNPLGGLAVITNSNGEGGVLYPVFDGQVATAGAVLVKYTYLGDTDLSGSVDATDLANTLAGMSGGLTGWVNGDFNYDGVVNGADVSLLLASLQGQGASVGGAVPEPGGAVCLVSLGALGCRRRRVRGA